MQRLLNRIYRLPIIGDLFYYALFVVGWLVISPVTAILGGGQRLRFGSSVIWIPKQKAQIVRKGVELLQSCDPEMFSRLTSKQRLIIYYIPPKAKFDRKSNHRVFLMHDKFVEFGPEGVACFIAQSLMVAAAVHHINQHKLDDKERAELKLVSRNMAEWLNKHSFQSGLINAYQKVVERQKQSAGAV